MIFTFAAMTLNLKSALFLIAAALMVVAIFLVTTQGTWAVRLAYLSAVVAYLALMLWSGGA